MLFKTEDTYSVGSLLELCLFVPGDKFVSVRVEVAYVREGEPAGTGLRVGVRFLDLEPALIQVIRQFVDEAA